MRRLVIILIVLLLLIFGIAECRSRAAQRGAAVQIQITPVPTPLATAVPVVVEIPALPANNPVAEIALLVENSEWYIDGWAEDAVVAMIYGREIRFDLAEFRHLQTHTPIVVQCIDPNAARPNLDFTRPIEQRDRFVFRAHQFWHTTDASVQRFIFIREGQLP